MIAHEDHRLPRHRTSGHVHHHHPTCVFCAWVGAPRVNASECLDGEVIHEATSHPEDARWR